MIEASPSLAATERARARQRRWLLAGGLVAVIGFALLAGRFWHPYYGFTKFVQLDAADARTGIHEIREHPVFTYEGFNGYDGAAYTQIAFHPLLDSPELQPALGNVPYRARRILGSALAWILAGGNPARIASTYAGLNLAVWLALAVLLWRVLPVNDGRSLLAWAGALFSAGALHSVRLALTDLLAATLVVAAIACSERARPNRAMGLLAAAGLARETALAAVAGLWRGPWLAGRAWASNLLRAALVALPLFAWMLYVRWKAGPAAQGLGNFTWPVVGWVEKWSETLAEFARHPDFRWLTTTTLLAVIALTAQAVYLTRRPLLENPWWRVGVAGVAMMILLGTSVWEGHPGATTRVLLPMSLAFAVVAVRMRAHWGWVAGGSLTVFSGVLALWHVPHSPGEIAAGRFAHGAYIAQVGDGWYGVERSRGRAWAWSASRADIAIETAPRTQHAVNVRLKLRAIAPRTVEVRVDGALVWQGDVGEKLKTIAFPATTNAGGKLTLAVRSDAAATRENHHPDARSLGFALYGVALD